MNYSSKCFIRVLTAFLVALVIIGVVFHEAPLAKASDEVSFKIDLARAKTTGTTTSFSGNSGCTIWSRICFTTITGT